MFQSTHLHEVWLNNPVYGILVNGFNPHTYMRCDLFRCCSEFHNLRFQSTHLHEVWLVFVGRVNAYRSFNPHTYMRCDPKEIPIKLSFAKFQSTHLHEVWPKRSYRLLFTVSVSIHTPTWGVTCGFVAEYFHLQCFNPHTYMRCDQHYQLEPGPPIEVSIHTPTWGVTCIQHL